MSSENSFQTAPAATSSFSADDLASILRDRGWLTGDATAEMQAWLVSAAALLGPHAPDRTALENLLQLIFDYDARAMLQSADAHAVMAREGAREVIRLLAHLVLEGTPVDSDRFKSIISTIKDTLAFRGRELFYPIRLSLAGRVGEGELDRIILLLDSAAALPFAVSVKGTRQRMLEFCSAFD